MTVEKSDKKTRKNKNKAKKKRFFKNTSSKIIKELCYMQRGCKVDNELLSIDNNMS